MAERVGRRRSGAVFVLLTLADPEEHRRRLEGRTRGLAHVPEPSWEDVLVRAAGCEPWAEATCVCVDAGPPVHELVHELQDRLADLRSR